MIPSARKPERYGVRLFRQGIGRQPRCPRSQDKGIEVVRQTVYGERFGMANGTTRLDFSMLESVVVNSPYTLLVGKSERGFTV